MEELMEEIQEARRIKLLHQPSKVRLHCILISLLWICIFLNSDIYIFAMRNYETIFVMLDLKIDLNYNFI